MITLFDTETTGLLQAEGNDLSVQPHIIEIYAVQINDNGEIVNEIETFVKPPIPIPKFITKITGITDQDVENAPIFLEAYGQILPVFWKSHTVIAHNLTFDEGMLVNELKRIGKEFSFPYPPTKFCTIEQSMHIKGYRLKNGELYKIATGKELVNAHRAKSDVMAMYESYKFLIGG